MRNHRPGPPPKKPLGPGTPETPTEVHLKSFLGMRPGLYLSILYSIIVLLLLFFLLFYKGLRDHGTFLRVSTIPAGAAVTVDGQYAGSTPCEVLVRGGERTVTVSRPFFESQNMKERFGGPVFGTLFVRPRRAWELTLKLNDPKGLIKHAIQDFADNPQIPEILVDAVAAGFAGGEGVQDQLYALLDISKYFITSSMQLPALMTAFSRVASGHHILTPESLLGITEKIVQLNEEYQNFAFWVAAILSEESAKKLVKTRWYQDFTNRYAAMYKEQLNFLKAREGPPSLPAYRFSGLTFHGIPSGVLLQGSTDEKNLAVHLPHAVKIQGFLMSETEVPNRIFRAFVQAVPQWRKNNLQELTDLGLAAANYLETWTGEDYPASSDDAPVTGVSWYAAQAFCRWFNSQIPGFLSGYEARLPSESEWEWAARGGIVGAAYPLGSKPMTEVFYQRGISGPRPVGSSSPNGYGLRDTSGNVWEWCSDWYSPVVYLFTSWKADRNSPDTSGQITDGAEKSVRGGSWANEKELVKLYTRASQPPSWCTPYLGFRIILAKKTL
jgi:iron(II)-dependent oxidoreductase